MTKTELSTGSPYASGGGGVHLEHEYAAAALASLLLAQPVDGLGDDFATARVSLQQGASSPVDDVVVEGTAPGGSRTIRIACRRRPKIGESDKPTVRLFADFLKVVISKATLLQTGELRLGLAVSGHFRPTAELGTLTEVARRQPGPRAFEAAIESPRAYSARVRARLKHVKKLVAAAMREVDDQLEDETGYTWRLLRALFVISTEFEGDVASDRTRLVSRLQALTGDSSVAEQLRLRLVDIASQGALRAAAMTRSMLRAELRPFGQLGSAPDFEKVRPLVASLESELRARTPSSVPIPGRGETFSIKRDEIRDRIVEALVAAGPGGVVVIHGEPDVGKSALAISAIDSVREMTGVALAISVRDLPNRIADLSSTLGMSLDNVFASAPSAPQSVVLIDGVEIVQESGADSVGAIIEAAAAAGRTTALVVRDDALDSVLDTVKSRGISDIRRIAVSSLSETELRSLTAAIPALNRLAEDERSNWLLRRIGLVELLLKAAAKGGGLPHTLSSEAEIFATVWSGLIRQNEKVIDGVSPDDRETALTDVAKELLTGVAQPISAGRALAQLRSDGLLLSRTRSASWDFADGFASDVLRDFAVARLMLRQGIGLLANSSAPRWAIRSTRLYAQASTARALRGNLSLFPERWRQLRSEFADLVPKFGARWLELVWEALFTAAWSPQAIDALGSSLSSDTALREEAIRTLMLRFSEAGACEPAVVAPLVSFLIETPTVFTSSRWPRDETAADLLLTWLRGVARLEATDQNVSPFRQLRARLRDVFLASEIDSGDQKKVEALGLMGADTCDSIKTTLECLANDSPGFLSPIVEGFDATTLLAHHNPELLETLADAYYIERPSDHPWRTSFHEDGIRSHQHRGFGEPLAAWYFGPFAALLRRDPGRGIRLINRMLDSGARARLANLNELDRRAGRETLSDDGIDLNVLSMGARRYIGDPHVWSWYRGCSVGPCPCTSALLALELCLDTIFKQGMTLRELSLAVMKDAGTLASLGLMYGFFVRHIEQVTDELDDFLATPEVWELEVARASSEGHLHIQRQEAATLANLDRRRWLPVDVASRLVLLANSRKDSNALERLRCIGIRLIDAAGGEHAPPHVLQWAAHFDIARYSIVQDGNRHLTTLRMPEDVERAMESARQRSIDSSELIRLVMRYRTLTDVPYRPCLAECPDDKEIGRDYEVLRRLEVAFSTEANSGHRLFRAMAGVAAGVLHAAFKGGDINQESFEWALRLLLHVAIHAPQDGLINELSFSTDGPDRQAALALPLTLFDLGRDETSEGANEFGHALSQAFGASLASLAVEVRHYTAEGLRALFEQPCRQFADCRCWHEILWSAIDRAARAVKLGDRFKDGARQIEPISGDLSSALLAAPDNELMVSHMAPVVVVALDAAGSDSCLRQRANELTSSLIPALCRSAVHWANNHYEWRSEYQAAFAAATLRSDPDKTSVSVLNVANRLTGSLDALADFLHALLVVATHEGNAVSRLDTLWPRLMELGLRAIENAPRNHRRIRSAEKLVQMLVPSPTTVSYLENAGDVLEAARSRWLSMSAVQANVETWLAHARGEMSAVDSLVGFLQSQPLSTQVAPGLDWVRTIVVEDDGTPLTCGFLLVGWLTQLRNSLEVSVAASSTYRVILDALVLGNYRGARGLQQRDE